MSLLDVHNAVRQDAAPDLTIQRIEIDKLHGVYSYDLMLGEERSVSHPNLMILYGDNGSGKTTILRMVFNLLSPEEREGHRSYLARTSFAKFKVTLSDGTVIEAARPASPAGEHRGPYRYTAWRGKGKIVDHNFDVDPDGAVSRDQQKDSASYHKLMVFLNELGLKFHYLGDDRKVAIDYESSSYIQRHRYLAERRLSLLGLADSDEVLASIDADDGDDNLQQAISRAEDYVRREAFARSTRGSENANTVYTQLVKRLVKSPDLVVGDSLNDLAQLRGRLETLENRNKSFEQLGLSATLNVTELLDLLTQAQPRVYNLITEILEPYVEGINARLDALQNLHDTMMTFIKHLDEFYAYKRTAFHLNEGIRVFTATGRELKPSKLSSGEKQLLLLLCNAISARRSASVLIIDEPEISLNVKWQRQLIRSLLDCMRGSPAQLLFATHSLEIVSQYRENLVRLENLSGLHAE